MRRSIAALFSAAVVASLSAQAPPQRLTPAQVGINYDILAVRVPKQATPKREHFPDAWNNSLHIGRGAELVVLRPDGSQFVLHSPGGNASCADPFVSYDGKTVWFVVMDDPEFLHPQFNVSFWPSHIWKIDLTTGQRVKMTRGGAVAYAQSAHQIDPSYAAADLAPVELPDGRILFLSIRDGQYGVTMDQPAPVFWRMNPDGTNLERLEWFSQGGCQHPMVLRDGRIVWTHRNDAGARMGGGHNHALMVANPDMSDIKSFAGMHFRNTAWHFATELSTHDVVTSVYYENNNFGHGALVRFPVDPQHPTGQLFHPKDADPTPFQFNTYGVNDHYRRVGEQLITPWSLSGGITEIGNDDPAPLLPNGSYAGKSTMPAAAPDGNMLFIWSSGPVHDPVFPDMKLCFAPNGRLDQHSDIVVLAEDPNYHYMYPRPIVPYSRIFGVERPARIPDTTNDGSAHPSLPPGSPFASTGTSSVYNRESSWPVSYSDAWSQTLFDYGQKMALQHVGQDTYAFPNSEIHAAQVVVDMARVDTRNHQLLTDFKTHNNGDQLWGILGEIPLRKVDGQGQTIFDPLGDPDTSYEVRIPANVPFHHRLLDRNGLTLTAENTWHSARPGERKVNCGGCHAHSVQRTELPFSQTVAGQSVGTLEDFALRTPLIHQDAQGQSTVLYRPERVRMVEYFKDIKPIFDAKCASCHLGASPAGGLNLKLNNAWAKLAYNHDPLVTVTEGSHQMTRYVRRNAATQSYLAWKVFGGRLDGRTNASRNDDWDYTGQIMPPPGSPQLTFQEKRAIANWIDLGCLVDLTRGQPTIADPFDDQMKPSLVISDVETDYNEHPIDQMTVSVYDAHSGIDPNSLVVTVRPNGGLLSQNLAAGIQTQDGGIYTIPMPPMVRDRFNLISVSVADNAGNFTRRDLRVRPLSLHYTQSEWIRGQNVNLKVTGAQPGEILIMLGSLSGPGIGPFYFGKAVRVDLLNPVVVSPLVADQNGEWEVNFILDPSMTLSTYHTQFIAVRGAGGQQSVKSRPLWADIK